MKTTMALIFLAVILRSLSKPENLDTGINLLSILDGEHVDLREIGSGRYGGLEPKLCLKNNVSLHRPPQLGAAPGTGSYCFPGGSSVVSGEGVGTPASGSAGECMFFGQILASASHPPASGSERTYPPDAAILNSCVSNQIRIPFLLLTVLGEVQGTGVGAFMSMVGAQLFPNSLWNSFAKFIMDQVEMGLWKVTWEKIRTTLGSPEQGTAQELAEGDASRSGMGFGAGFWAGMILVLVTVVWLTFRVSKALVSSGVTVTQQVCVRLSASGIFEKLSRQNKSNVGPLEVETELEKLKQQLEKEKTKAELYKKQYEMATRCQAPSAESLTPPGGATPIVSLSDSDDEVSPLDDWSEWYESELLKLSGPLRGNNNKK